MTLDTYEDLVVEMKMKYYDTVPPANSMCILKTGFLFVAAEFGDQSVFKNVKKKLATKNLQMLYH